MDDITTFAFGFSQMKPFHAIALVAVLLLLGAMLVITSD